MKHYKEIEITDTGMIVARVYCEDGRRTALEFFGNGFLDQFISSPERTEKHCLEAHKWADKMIEVCDKYEIKAGEK